MLTGKEKRKYTVWVGGTEVTDHFVNYTTAKQLHLTTEGKQKMFDYFEKGELEQ